jgi:hypothetical protein
VSLKEKKKNAPKPKKIDEEDLGLPEYGLVYKDEKEKAVTWETVEGATGEPMSWENVMYPLASGDTLEKIYINMDSTVLKNFKSKYKRATQEQLEIADRKYIASVYFHTLFLYTITKNRQYEITREAKDGKEEIVDVGTYLRDIFESYYSEFILNFGGMKELMESIGE